MADVAARAGVSHQTVSRVLNGMPGVRPETHDRVMAAVEELKYRRNFAARQLASARSRTLGVVTWGTSQFGPANVLLALEAAARDSHYRLATVSVLSMSREALRSAVDQLLEQAVEALVVIVPHESVLREAHSLGLDVPVVVVEGDLSETPLTAGVDNAQGARLATAHLLVARPRDRRAPVRAARAGPSRTPARDGWRAELEAQGRRVPPLRWGGDWSARSGYLTGASLAREADVTAVFVANDQMALGLHPGAARGRPPGARGRQRGRLRRPARGAVLRAAADHDPPGLRGARAPGDGRPGAGARRRGAADARTWCRPPWWSGARRPGLPRDRRTKRPPREKTGRGAKFFARGA